MRIRPIESSRFFIARGAVTTSIALLSVVACSGNKHTATNADANGANDAGGIAATQGEVDAGPPPCTVTDVAAICTTRPIVTITNGTDARRVYWNTAAGALPAQGRDVVVLFQGSLFGPSYTWNASVPETTGFGGYYQVALVAKLIESGFTVVQPEAQNGLVWDTNDGADYDTSLDAVFVPALLAAIQNGTFGTADMTHLYATGISSGGYMTSRMAVSYPGTFRALAIESGSYATCLGPICTIPDALPADHPPTLFLHGGADNTVPIATAQAYFQKLQAAGIETKFVEDPAAGHQWLATAPTDVTEWFLGH